MLAYTNNRKGSAKVKRIKFEWNIFKEDQYIVINLNGDCNSMIDTRYADTLETNKAAKKAEIEFWSTVNKSTVKGMELLNP